MRRRNRISGVGCACAVVCLLLARSALAATPLDTLLRDADQRRGRDAAAQTEALRACRDVLSAPKVTAKQKARAYEIMADIHSRRGAHTNLIAVAEAMRLAFPKDADTDRRAVFLQADAYWNWKQRPDDAIAALKGFAARRPENHGACAQALLRVARFEARTNRWDAAMQSARAAIAADAANANLGVEALWFMQDTAGRAGRPEARLEALKELIEPRYQEAMRYSDLTARRDLYVAALLQLKRLDEARRCLGQLEVADTDPLNRQKWCYGVADTWLRQTNLVAAAAVFERVFTAHPTVRDRWPEAQDRLVDVMVAQKRYDDALRAGRVALDACRDVWTVERQVNRLADIWRTKEGPKSAHADALMIVRRYGPNGRDGVAGTADDATNPLNEVAYPDYAERRKAFDAAAPTLGDGTAAALQRGWARVYAADPRAALAQFADALRRCPVDQLETVTQAVVFNGFRPLLGITANLEPIGFFIAYGPVGPDGQAGTTDDVRDPFSAYGVSVATRSPLPDTQVVVLRELQMRLVALVERSETQQRRLDALNAYVRVCETLVVVDQAATLAWVRQMMAKEQDARAGAALARLAQTVAKAGQLDASGVRRFWVETAQGGEVPKHLTELQRSFERSLRAFEPKLAKRK